MKKNYALKSAFSLMEMMIVLLIVAIIAAATAPMVSKKMLMSATSGDSPWVFANTNGTIAYNLGAKNMSAIIGASSYDANGSAATYPRLVLSAGNVNHPAMVFATGTNGKYLGQINMTADTVTMQGGTGTVGTNSVAMGMAQQQGNTNGTTAIGYGTTTKGILATAIGYGAIAGNGSSCNHPTAIGSRANATGSGSVAIGGNAASAPNQTTASGANSVAIGQGAQATGGNAVAIGQSAKATKSNSVAIGNTEPSADWEIRLGNSSHTVAIPGSLQLDALSSTTDNGNAKYVSFNNKQHLLTLGAVNDDGTSLDTVYIPGNLIVHGSVQIDNNLRVQGDVALATSNGHSVWAGVFPHDARVNWHVGEIRRYSYDDALINNNKWSDNVKLLNEKLSDKRLKNIGSKYCYGLAELKKLDLYHFTFKNDKDKTPQVGVIAQDLQKVFPDAVTKGHDGYLRIRWDEMFYAVINAVKELDTRVTALAEQVKSNFDETKELKSTVAEQQKTIEAQQKTIDELLKRVEKLEK